MQEKYRKFYKSVAEVLRTERKKSAKFTIFCYENDIAKSLLNTIENGNTQTYFANVARVVKALGLSFEEFGKLLDDELGKDFTFTDIT